MKDKKILVKWNTDEPVEMIGHQMPDGWWYIYLPFDHAWHYVQEEDVSEVKDVI